MNRIIFLLVVGLVWFWQVSSSFGAALEGAGLGARQRVMGGAFIGLADDWTAIYWNPAGLSRQKTRGGGIELDYVIIEGEDGNSVANCTFTTNPEEKAKRDVQGDIFTQFPLSQYGTEPTKFNRKDIKVYTLLPGLGVYTPFSDFVIAGGVYEPIGYSSKWNDEVSGVTASYEIKLYEIVYTLSMAKQVSPELAVGVGLNFLQGNYEKHAKKNVPNKYNFYYDMEGDGTGFEGVLGLMYRPHSNLSIGAVYRSGSKVTLDGTANIKTPVPITGTTTTVMLEDNSDYEQVFYHPSTYGIGVAYNPMPKLVILADWVKTNWATMRNQVDFKKSTQFWDSKDKDNDVEWKITGRLRVGTEYQLNDCWTIRGGIFTDPSPVPDKAVSLTNIIDVDFTYLGLGLGYNYKDWQIDFGMLLTENDRDAEGVHYEKKSTSYLIGGRGKF